MNSVAYTEHDLKKEATDAVHCSMKNSPERKGKPKNISWTIALIDSASNAYIRLEAQWYLPNVEHPYVTSVAL
jgi:hypothetical protein